MSLPEVALVCFDNPYVKPMSGGKRAMLTRIESLKILDIDLNVFLLTNPNEGIADITAAQSERCHIYQYMMSKLPPISLVTKYPICVGRRYVSGLADRLADRHYDAVIYEGAQVSSYRFEGKVNADRHILYYHDIESVYRAQLAQSENNSLGRYLQNRESRLFARMEGRLPELFDCHLFVSCDEREQFASEHGLGDTAVYAPYAVDSVADKVPMDAVPGRMLYAGDMSLDSNYRSMEWFVRKVLPNVRFDGGEPELRLVGRISEEHKRHLEVLDSRVRVLGYVDDLDSEYESACCFVAPILYGAGVKVKLIDAMARGQIVIANTKACEGTRAMNGENLLVADEPEAMAGLCSAVLNHREEYVSVAENGLEFIRRYHSKEAQAELFRREIES